MRWGARQGPQHAKALMPIMSQNTARCTAQQQITTLMHVQNLTHQKSAASLTLIMLAAGASSEVSNASQSFALAKGHKRNRLELRRDGCWSPSFLVVFHGWRLKSHHRECNLVNYR
jgi:hypothetical protein